MPFDPINLGSIFISHCLLYRDFSSIASCIRGYFLLFFLTFNYIPNIRIKTIQQKQASVFEVIFNNMKYLK